MQEFVNWDLLEYAYQDFLVHKRTTTSAYEYMLVASRDLPKLKQELENGTYAISKSVAFCVTRPKLREVFAAAPRDRVVHHLLICQFGEMFENLSIEESFNCRKGKGNSAMTAYVGEALRDVGSDGYVCKTDIQSCFMTIDKLTKMADCILHIARSPMPLLPLVSTMPLPRGMGGDGWRIICLT